MRAIFSFNYNDILFVIAHQTYYMINVYHVLIISYLYPVLYHILPLSYPDHQTGPKRWCNIPLVAKILKYASPRHQTQFLMLSVYFTFRTPKLHNSMHKLNKTIVKSVIFAKIQSPVGVPPRLTTI